MCDIAYWDRARVKQLLAIRAQIGENSPIWSHYCIGLTYSYIFIDFIFHNKMPKCGGSTMNAILEQLSEWNDYDFVRLQANFSQFDLNEKFSSDLQAIRNQVRCLLKVLIRQICWYTVLWEVRLLLRRLPWYNNILPTVLCIIYCLLFIVYYYYCLTQFSESRQAAVYF